MASGKTVTYKMILEAMQKGVSSTFSKASKAITVYQKTLDKAKVSSLGLDRTTSNLIGTFLGWQTVMAAKNTIVEIDNSIFSLKSSVEAANREFSNLGVYEDWESAVDSLRDKLKVFSKSDIRTAISMAIDMTKRYGLTEEQMRKLVEVTADLSIGKTTLADGMMRTTSALRGEAEASEYLALTLNETYIKSWYEAAGATQGAWKDLDDMQKAQVRFGALLEQANPILGRSAESVNTLAGAYNEARAKIVDSFEENQALIDSMKEIATVIRENSDEIGELASDIITIAAKTIEWTAKNQELVKHLAGAAGIVWAIGKVGAVIKTIYAHVSALAAAFATLTSSAGLLATGLRVSLFGSVAYGIIKIGQLIKVLWEWKSVNDQVQEGQKKLAESQERFKQKLDDISAATGVSVNNIQELRQAFRDGRIEYDELTNTYKKGSGKIVEVAEETGEKQKKISKATIDKLTKQYEEYVDEIKSLQKEIVDREQSLHEQLREMARSGMTDIQAWRDRKKEAEEYYRIAQQAVSAGDWDKAVEYADKAKDAYSDLNEEVKEGDSVLISQADALKIAMEGVESAGHLAIEALSQQEQEATKAADALTKDIEFEKLISGMDEAKQAWIKNWKGMEDETLEGLDKIKWKIEEVFKDQYMTVYVSEEVQKRWGGIVQKLNSGGRLFGYGGGDKIRALLEAGEFVLRKEAVKFFGDDVLYAMNNLRIPDLSKVRKYQDGGAVEAGDIGQSLGFYELAFSFPGVSPIRARVGNKTDARSIVNAFHKLQKKSSGA